jgi:hypothetical protein
MFTRQAWHFGTRQLILFGRTPRDVEQATAIRTDHTGGAGAFDGGHFVRHDGL